MPSTVKDLIEQAEDRKRLIAEIGQEEYDRRSDEIRRRIKEYRDQQNRKSQTST